MSWSGDIGTSETLIDLGTSLADATLSAVGATVDNGNASYRNTHWMLELTRDGTGNLFGSAVTAADALVDLYMRVRPDGSKWTDPPVGADIDEYVNMFLTSFRVPTKNFDESEPLHLWNIIIPPTEFALYAYNSTGQTLDATWEINGYPYDAG